MLFKKKPAPAVVITAPVEPTLEERLASANRAANLHLSAFVRAADGLEKAANDFDVLGAEFADVEKLAAHRKVDADSAASQHRVQAQKIRELIGQ